MSDQYVPQDRPGFAGYRPSVEPRFPEATRFTSPVLVRPAGGSGLGTGLMVCGVFVVIAVFAATFYSPFDSSAPVVNQPVESVIQSDGSAVQPPAEVTPGIEPAVAPVSPQPAAAAPAPATPAAAPAPATPPAAPAQP